MGSPFLKEEDASENLVPLIIVKQTASDGRQRFSHRFIDKAVISAYGDSVTGTRHLSPFQMLGLTVSFDLKIKLLNKITFASTVTKDPHFY